MTLNSSNCSNRRFAVRVGAIFKFRTSNIIRKLITRGFVDEGVRGTGELYNYSSNNRLLISYRLFRFLMNLLYRGVNRERYTCYGYT